VSTVKKRGYRERNRGRGGGEKNTLSTKHSICFKSRKKLIAVGLFGGEGTGKKK